MFQPHITQELIVEQWILSSIGVILLLLRFAIRLRTVGLREFQADDYASIGTMVFTIAYAVSVHEAELKGQNLDVTTETIQVLTSHDVARLEYGSKMQLFSWYSYSALIWCLKVTILCFYKRLTNGSPQAKMVKWVSIATGIAYVAVFLVTTFGCHPFHANWQISPMAPWSCRFRPEILVTVATLNVITSAGILCIPAPMLWKLKISRRKKLGIALSLSSAIIVITSAIIRASVTLSIEPSAANINAWGVRETVLGTLAVNIPILRLLFTRALWARGPYTPDGHAHSHKKSIRSGDVERGVSLKAYEVGVRNSGGSQENIIGERHKGKDVVVIQTTLEIEHHDRRESVTAGGNGHHNWSNLTSTK